MNLIPVDDLTVSQPTAENPVRTTKGFTPSMTADRVDAAVVDQ
jgi:hypothetical protein